MASRTECVEQERQRVPELLGEQGQGEELVIRGVIAPVGGEGREDVGWKRAQLTLVVVAVAPLTLNLCCIAFDNNQSSDILIGARNGPWLSKFSLNWKSCPIHSEYCTNILNAKNLPKYN